MSKNADEKVTTIARLSSCLKTESRVRMVLAMKGGASRPLDVVRQSGENPSTLYRIVDEMIEAGVVLRTEPVQGEVHWRLTTLGSRLISSMEEAALPGASSSVAAAKTPWWIHFIIPMAVILLSGVRAAQLHEWSYVLGGVILAGGSYYVTKRLLK